MQETILTTEFIDQFLDSLSDRGLSSNTIRAYRADLNQFHLWVMARPLSLQSLPLDQLSRRWLEEYRRKMSPKTTGRRATTLRTYAKWCGLEILKDYNTPTPPRTQPHPIPESVEGLHRMAEAAKNPEQEALIGLCGFAGLRIAEALSVRPRDIHCYEGLITVRGKGDKTRVVPMSDTCWRYIASAYVAAWAYDKPLISYRDRFARKAITRMAERAGLQRHVASHDLRATFATAVYDSTLDLRLVQELLGHSSPDTTQVYTGIDMAKMKEAVKI